MRRKMALYLALLLMFMILPAHGGTPYKTYTRSYQFGLAQTQTAYEPVRTLTRFGDERLKTPSDLRMGPDGYLYICDSGNNRVLVVTTEGELVKTIGDKKTLRDPKGVFAAGNGLTYVADEAGRKVAVFDKTGKVVAEYVKPAHPLFGETAPFKPVKVVVDKRGNLYIVSTGNTNGIVQLSPNEGGTFLGYFGANLSNVSFLTMVRKAIFTDEQLDRTADILPTSVVNLSIDEKGMVFTVSQTGDSSTLRKLNVAGKNILNPDWYDAYPAAVTTNASGAIYMASKNGYIYEYTAEGRLLFVFGSKDDGQQRTGLFQSVAGIAADGAGNLYVLDEISGGIQVFTPTEFADTVHQAFSLFQSGKYTESKAPWKQVLRMNSLFSYANTGLGEALYREGDFEGALASFRNGGSYPGYSDAFWELRSNWLHANLAIILLWIVAAIVLWQAVKLLHRKTNVLVPVVVALNFVGNVSVIKKTGYCFHMMKNPFDTCYGIKRERRAGYLSASIILLLFFLMFVVEKYFSGFLFKTVPDGYFDLFSDFVRIFGVYALLVICCYLVCTVNEGEATFRDMVIGTAYALAPLLILKPLIIVLTNVLTYNEEFFISFANVVGYGWTGINMVLAVMYLNDYSFKKTVKVIILTLFTALISVALLFVVYVLISQFVDFVSSVYGEVVYRFVKS